jgi:hypothetical protein
VTLTAGMIVIDGRSWSEALTSWVSEVVSWAGLRRSLLGSYVEETVRPQAAPPQVSEVRTLWNSLAWGAAASAVRGRTPGARSARPL